MSNQANIDALAAHIKAWGKENPSGALRGIESSFAEYLAQAGVLDPSVLTDEQCKDLVSAWEYAPRGGATRALLRAMAAGDA